MIQYTEDKENNDIWKGYVYMICMVVVAVVQLVALQQYFHIAYSTGMRIRSGVLGIVYAKVCCLVYLRMLLLTLYFLTCIPLYLSVKFECNEFPLQYLLWS